MIPYFTILGRMIPMYGVCCTIGITLAGLLALVIGKKRNIDSNNLIISACAALGGGFLGAKLLFLLVSIKTVIKIFQTHKFVVAMQAIMSGGFVFYGGLIGGILGL